MADDPRTRARTSGRRSLPVAASTLAGLMLVLASCGNSGRDLSAPLPGAVQPERATTPPSTAPQGPWTLTSPAVTAGGVLPAQYTCGGTSPELSWAGKQPDGTIELAITMQDTTTGTFDWFVAAVNSGATTSPAGGSPENVADLTTDNGRAGYQAPCPPPGETHTVVFSVLALKAAAGLPTGANAKVAWAAVQPNVVGTVTLQAQVVGATSSTSAPS